MRRACLAQAWAPRQHSLGLRPLALAEGVPPHSVLPAHLVCCWLAALWHRLKLFYAQQIMAPSAHELNLRVYLYVPCVSYLAMHCGVVCSLANSLVSTPKKFSVGKLSLPASALAF